MRRFLLLIGGVGLVAVCALAGVFMFWFSREEQPRYVWHVTSRSVIFLPDGRLAIANDRQTSIMSFPEYQTIRDLPAGGYLAINPDGSRLAIGLRGTVKLYDPDTGNLVGEFNCWPLAEHNYEMSLAFSPDGRILAVAEGHFSRGPEVQFWDVMSQRQIGAVQINEPDAIVIAALAFGANGQLVVSAYDSGVWLVDVERRAVVHKIHDWPSRSLAFSADGSRLSLSDWQTIRTLDTTTWRIIHEQTLTGQTRERPSRHIASIFSLPIAISPDDRWLVTPNRLRPTDSFSLFEPGPPRQTIALRQLSDGRRVRVLSGQPVGSNYFVFSPDSQWLLGVNLSEIRAWRIAKND